MNETNLTPRQNLILILVNNSSGISRSEIEERVNDRYPSSKPTIARDLALLGANNLIRTQGKAKNTIYFPSNNNPLLRFIDINKYFAQDVDQREGKAFFDFKIFNHLQDLISDQEKEGIEKVNKSFKASSQSLSEDIYKRELERFVIELSWKSSKIEGNTYTLLDTETLIKQKIEASGHPKEEAIMILNHKEAFDKIIQNKDDFRYISLSQLTQLHNILINGLSITSGIRSEPVGITGTIYKPLDNSHQITEALEKTVEAINNVSYPLEKALIASTMVSYIQPFADGNKRTGRMITNAILLANDYFPLSYRSVDETIFKEALLLFYEQLSIIPFKKLILDQYKFALNTYFN